ncbi:MAG: hypothetical protein ACN2B6_02300 [Rickettsiales bacterium]
MSIWVIQQQLTAEQEADILLRKSIELPFDGMPDLSMVANQSECKRLLQTLHPDQPPESIQLMLDRLWNQFSGIGVDDTVAVPLPMRKEVAIARVDGKYYYKMGKNGEDHHLIDVQWYPRTHPITSFGKSKHVFASDNLPMMEINNKEAREKILAKLPYKYNRFSKLKWIAAIFIFFHAARMLGHLFQ